MLHLLWMIALLACANTLVEAQSPAPDEAAILAVVDRFMIAVSTNDAKAMADVHVEGAVHTGVRIGESGESVVNRRVLVPGGGKPSVRRERYWDPVVHVRGSIAIVWTPYEFWLDGKTSHCGIDAFDLVKQDGAWRIANMMWTVEPGACPELRPSDPARVRPPQ